MSEIAPSATIGRSDVELAADGDEVAFGRLVAIHHAVRGCDSASQSCWACPTGPLEVLFQVGSRLYAIPTGDDTIIAVVESDEGALQEALLKSDELVRSLTFD